VRLSRSYLPPKQFWNQAEIQVWPIRRSCSTRFSVLIQAFIFPVDARRSKNDTKHNLYPPYRFVVGGCWNCTQTYFYDTTAEHPDFCSSFAACNIWCVSRRSPRRGISVDTFLAFFFDFLLVEKYFKYWSTVHSSANSCWYYSSTLTRSFQISVDKRVLKACVWSVFWVKRLALTQLSPLLTPSCLGDKCLNWLETVIAVTSRWFGMYLGIYGIFGPKTLFLKSERYVSLTFCRSFSCC